MNRNITELARSTRKRVRQVQHKALKPVTSPQQALLQIGQLQLAMGYRDLVAEKKPLPSYRDVGFRVFCDADEDGILHHGWSGLLVDGNAAGVEQARQDYATRGVIPPQMVGGWITAENVNDLVRDNIGDKPVDLVSIDIDGNDYWVWKALDVNPRVVVIEYQDIIGPERSITIPYDPSFVKSRYPQNAEHNNYVGGSLRAMVNLGRSKGYRLVATNSYGFNAFFVRDDLAPELLPEIPVEAGFPHAWNEFGFRERWPLVQGMPWEEV